MNRGMNPFNVEFLGDCSECGVSVPRGERLLKQPDGKYSCGSCDILTVLGVPYPDDADDFVPCRKGCDCEECRVGDFDMANEALPRR